MRKLERFAKVRIHARAGTVDCNITRIGSNGWLQTGRYRLKRGEPSTKRLGRLLASKPYTRWDGWRTYVF